MSVTLLQFMEFTLLMCCSNVQRAEGKGQWTIKVFMLVRATERTIGTTGADVTLPAPQGTPGAAARAPSLRAFVSSQIAMRI